MATLTGQNFDAKTASRRAQKSPAMKMSVALELSDSRQPFLVVFYESVSRWDAELIVTQAGLRRIEHPDLLPNHVVAEGNREQAEALAQRSEVAYLLPASEELISGAPAAGCLGPMMAETQVANYVSTVGHGWDGVGPGSVDLTYSFSSLTQKMPRDVLITSVVQALAEWERHAEIHFTYSDFPGKERDLNFVFATGDHGDPYPFDGPHRVLAHTFYPSPVNPEPIAGDLHFDEDENWYNGGGTDFYSVVLHEIGHALGLGHADRPNAVMYPYYRRATSLGADDIAALQRLYAPRVSEPVEPTIPAPEPEPPQIPTFPVPVPTGGSGPVLPDLPSSDEPASSEDKVAPAMTITSPSVAVSTTSSPTGRISGIASDRMGVVQVNWSASGDRSGVASGTTQWTIEGIPLRVGDNRITVRAVDAAGNARSRTVTIVRR
jgi:hypothetical protein